MAIFVGYLMPKPSLLNNSSGIIHPTPDMQDTAGEAGTNS